MEKTNLKYHVHNSNSDHEITLVIEPWAEEVMIPPNSKAVLHLQYENLTEFELDVQNYVVALWLWDDCNIRIMIDGHDCTPIPLTKI